MTTSVSNFQGAVAQSVTYSQDSNNNNAYDLVTVANSALFAVGQTVQGSNIPLGTTVKAIVNGTTLQLSQTAIIGAVTLVLTEATGVVDMTAQIPGDEAWRNVLAPYPTGSNNTNLPNGDTTSSTVTTSSTLNSVDGTISYSFWLNMPVPTGESVTGNSKSYLNNLTQLLGRESDPSQGGAYGGVLQVILIPYYTGAVGSVTVTDDANGNLDTITGLTSVAGFQVGDR